MRTHVCSLANSEVLDSRKDPMHGTAGKVHRRRRCLRCLNGFATVEVSLGEYNDLLRLKKLLRQLFAAMNADAQNPVAIERV